MSRKGIRDARVAFCRTAVRQSRQKMATDPTAGSGQEVAATKGGKKDGALKGRRYDGKFEERAQRRWSTERTGLKTRLYKRPTITEALNQGG